MHKFHIIKIAAQQNCKKFYDIKFLHGKKQGTFATENLVYRKVMNKSTQKCDFTEFLLHNDF